MALDLNIFTRDSETGESKTLPDFYVAADSHNIGNGNFQLTDETSWGEDIGDVGKFVIASAYSGANSFYNSFAQIGNFFGADIEEIDTAKALTDLDDDLGQYYTANKEYADLAGFVVGSFVPGLAGIKLLNAGKSALVAARSGAGSRNIGGAMGLLQSPTVLAEKAAAEIAASQASHTILTRGTAKALSSGAVAGVLEGAAFEAAVQATMFASPVLENQDASDIAQSFLIAGTFGGVLSGVIEGARTLGTIKKTVTALNEQEKPFSFINVLSPDQGSANKLIQAYEDLTFTPSVVAQTDPALTRKFEALRSNKITRLSNDIRTNVNEMVNGNDGVLASMLADNVFASPLQSVSDSFQYVKRFGRVGEKLPEEKVLAKTGVQNPTAGSSTMELQYIKLTGDNIGNVTSEAPAVLRLADKLKQPEDITAYVNKQGFQGRKQFNAATQSRFITEARYIWAASAKIADSVPKLHIYDIPYQERVYEIWKQQAGKLDVLERTVGETPIQKVSVVDTGGKLTEFSNPDDFFRHIRQSKIELAETLLVQKQLAGEPLTHALDEIAEIANVRVGVLEGKLGGEFDDWLAAQSDTEKYWKRLTDAGVSVGEKTSVRMMPSYAKVIRDVNPILDADGNILRGAAYVGAKEKILRESMENAVAKNMGELYENFPNIPKSLLFKANQYGAGPKLLSFANGAYGSLESFVETIGANTAKLQKKLKDATVARSESIAYKLGNDQGAAVEFSNVSRQILQTSEHYILNETGDALVVRSMADYKAGIARGEKNLRPPTIQSGAPESIPLTNPIVRDAVRAHIEGNAVRVNGYKEIRAVQGLEDFKDARTFYPVRPNPTDYKHFAFVYDPSVTRGSAGHVSMITAASEKELAALMDRVPQNLKVRTKTDVEEFKKAMNDYDNDRTLHENYIDSELRRSGASSSFFPVTDPQTVAKQWLDSQFRADDIYARELVHAKYQPEFSELRRLGEQYTNIATSKFGSSFRYAESSVENPYNNYVRTALNISHASDNKLLQGFNEIVDSTFSRAWNSVSSIWKGVKSPEDLERLNTKFNELGIKTAYYDAATEILANHPAPRGELSKFVRRANSLLATLTLRTDPLNALNNAVGANVLLGAETTSLIRAIRRRDTNAAGALANLLDVNIPGVEDTISSSSKLIAKSMQRYFSDEGKTLKEFYRSAGWITDITSQFDSMIDDLTLRGSETAGELGGKINAAIAKASKFADKAEKVTGNRMAEEMNRFIAADVAKQISDLAVNSGLITAKEQRTYIGTFVNRTQGNILASQRPLLFNGPVGQAVGLFQTYQFNLAQQLLRYVGTGNGKDAAMLMGLQGTLYGLNGLPAFSYMNTHVVGTMSANPQHKDMYSTTYGILGERAGNWLMYGVPSNLLSTNLYTRGDINPRQLSVIPVNPADIAIVNATAKVFGNIKDSAVNIMNGGNVWQTFLQGVQNNGLSRPLAGLAQTAQAITNEGTAFSVSTRGTIIAENDLFSISTLSRLSGGRPLDEAKTLDAMYRKGVYQSLDTARKKALVKAIKSQGIGSGEVSGEEMETFAARYAELGGDTKGFNKYVYEQVVNANTSEANKVIAKVNSPYSKYMQTIMGGRDPQELE